MGERGRRPGIYQVGSVVDTGTHMIVRGWGLTLYAAACPCHRHPQGGGLVFVEDRIAGTFGLRSFRPCTCCEPWTAEELAAIISDLADVAWLEAQPG